MLSPPQHTKEKERGKNCGWLDTCYAPLFSPIPRSARTHAHTIFDITYTRATVKANARKGNTALAHTHTHTHLFRLIYFFFNGNNNYAPPKVLQRAVRETCEVEVSWGSTIFIL